MSKLYVDVREDLPIASALLHVHVKAHVAMDFDMSHLFLVSHLWTEVYKSTSRYCQLADSTATPCNQSFEREW